MKVLKTIYAILSFVLIITLTSGCGSLPSRTDLLNMIASKEHKENLETSKILINCLINKDAEGLKELFCSRTQDLSDIDAQIQEGFNFINESIISFDENRLSGSEGTSIDNGKITKLDRSWSITNITTNTSETYEIYVHKYYIRSDDKSREGISMITIYKSDGQEYTIGYKWPDYKNEGRDMACAIVNSFSEKDISGLKDLFCIQTLEIGDIDRQIQTAFDFFTDKIIDCWVTDRFGGEYFDGSRDWRWSVKDSETILNGEPTSTFIDTLIYSIKMDNGNEYEIRFYAYLLNADNEAYEGVSQIIISDNNGVKCIIGDYI